MKANVLLLSLLLSFIPLCNFAQTSASANNIAIQGIARDNNNTARIGEDISITFTTYYKNNGTNVSIGSPITAALTTDSFGVFSYILDPGVINNSKFTNYQMYLKIEEGNTLISDEKLNHVPYAIAANNGVPTGSIMPFIGDEAPEGWALCDGRPLPGTATELIAMVGANSPDLQGMFLRGTGTNPVNNQAGPALMANQDDGFEKHNHQIVDLSTEREPNHQHFYDLDTGFGGNNINGRMAQGEVNLEANSTGLTRPSGAHDHIINGSTNDAGVITETRPVNYGVNYIIKL